MSACAGSYRLAVRRRDLTFWECSVCARPFVYRDLAGEMKRNVPLHSPAEGSLPLPEKRP